MFRTKMETLRALTETERCLPSRLSLRPRVNVRSRHGAAPKSSPVGEGSGRSKSRLADRFAGRLLLGGSWAASAFLWGACAPSSAPHASEDAGVVMAVPRPADAWLGADRSATFRAHVERIRRVQAGTHAPSSPPCPAPNPVAISAHHGTQAAPFLKICPPATLTDGTSLRHSGSDGLRQHVRSTATVYSDGGLSCSQVLSV